MDKQTFKITRPSFLDVEVEINSESLIIRQGDSEITMNKMMWGYFSRIILKEDYAVMEASTALIHDFLLRGEDLG